MTTGIRRNAGMAAAALVLGLACSPVQAEESVVGGLTPSVRPANAPSIRAIHYGAEWLQKQLAGVSQPYPNTLVFLNNQGEWYTPFSRRGMPGRYDIRGLHGAR